MRNLLLAGLFVCLPSVVLAQAVCGDRQQILSTIEGRYGEVRIGMGAIDDGSAIYEIYTSPVKRTWTILRTGTDGVTCIMTAGEDYRVIVPLVGDPT